MKLKRITATIALAAALIGFGPSAQAVILSDIIIIVDESGSMSNVQTNLRNNIGTFASILQAGGLDVQFGLVGYGNNSIVPRMVTNLTNATGFATAAAGLVASGGTEPGYTASAFALNALDGQSSLFSFRANAVKNLIIFTDEATNGDTVARGAVGGFAVSYSILDDLLTDNSALYNAVTRSGAVASYSGLAAAHNGISFNLDGLNTTDQTVIAAFVQDFATRKLQETIDFCTANPTAPQCQGTTSVPEPSVLALLGLSLMGLGFMRRKA